jgi:DNA-directed RNA polymerase specialized sigma24 family protein
MPIRQSSPAPAKRKPRAYDGSVTSERPPRLRPLPPEILGRVGDHAPGLPDAELYERLEEALAALPQPERAAAVVAFGMGEGSAGVATELELQSGDAEALTRSALQLLRGALADVTLDDRQVHPRLAPRRRRSDDDA